MVKMLHHGGHSASVRVTMTYKFPVNYRDSENLPATELIRLRLQKEQVLFLLHKVS